MLHLQHELVLVGSWSQCAVQTRWRLSMNRSALALPPPLLAASSRFLSPLEGGMCLPWSLAEQTERVCDPQQFRSLPGLSLVRTRALLPTCCGSQSRAPQIFVKGTDFGASSSSIVCSRTRSGASRRSVALARLRKQFLVSHGVLIYVFSNRQVEIMMCLWKISGASAGKRRRCVGRSQLVPGARHRAAL